MTKEIETDKSTEALDDVVDALQRPAELARAEINPRREPGIRLAHGRLATVGLG